MTIFKKVAVALSGGIDSAVAAVLLKNKGFDVIGTFIKYWNPDNEHASGINRALENSRKLCDNLKIPFHEVDLVNTFWPNVFTDIIAEYNVGSIPNPDIICNEQIIFGCYHQYCLDKLNVDAVATGHCVQSSFGSFLQHYKPDQSARLLRSSDKVRDQTYVLCRISQKSLQRSMFPIGELKKTEVKQIAIDHSLDRIIKEDATSDICFIDPQLYKYFISRYVVGKPGKCIDIDTGKIVGEFQGLHRWTNGQCYPPNYFIVGNNESDVIFVVSRKDHPAFYCRSLTLSYCHWIREELSERIFLRSTFQYKPEGPLMDCKLVNVLDFPEGGYILLESELPLYAICPGQYAVLYDGVECLGSMKILSTGPSDVFYKSDSSCEERYDSDEINESFHVGGVAD